MAKNFGVGASFVIPFFELKEKRKKRNWVAPGENFRLICCTIAYLSIGMNINLIYTDFLGE